MRKMNILVMGAVFGIFAISHINLAFTQVGTPNGTKPVPPPQACVNTPNDTLCSKIPHDITEQFPLAGYSSLSAADQRPFDNFSWQTFIALNWPADANGKPKPGMIGSDPTAPRVWESYKTPTEVFNLPGKTALLRGASDIQGRRVFQMTSKSDALGEKINTGAFHQATGQPLIDRNLNFVVYDIVMNPVEVKYITTNGLNTKAGQQAFRDAGKQVSFPLGHYEDRATRTGGSVGAIEVKTAWRVMVKGVDDFSRYYTVKGVILINANESKSGKPLVLRETLGLVGFHVIQRTLGPRGFPQDWIWSTFEHAANAPLAADAREPTNISLPLPSHATSPMSVDQKYSFFNIDSSQHANQAPPAKAKWASNKPYARDYAVDGKYGTQVVRCWKIFPETQELNAYFQKQLKGTVWENYELIGTQWQGGVEDPETENGNIPRYLSNSTLETYIQFKKFGSCIDCHSNATTTAGQNANLSFLLHLAR